MSKNYTIAIVAVILVLAIAGVWWYVLPSQHSASLSPTQQSTAQANLHNAVNTPNPSTTNANSSSTNSLIGTWVSSVQGKGMQSSGKIVVRGTTVQISMNGDVNLVIKKVENNIAYGTIAFNNLCSTTIVSVPGKTAVPEPQRCINSDSKSVELQIKDNTLNFQNQTDVGVNISFVGNYTKDSISGTFTRTSSYGNIGGTFNLIRAKN